MAIWNLANLDHMSHEKSFVKIKIISFGFKFGETLLAKERAGSNFLVLLQYFLPVQCDKGFLFFQCRDSNNLANFPQNKSSYG
jgi:hypothetical protein